MHPYEELPMNIVGYLLAAWLIGFHLWMLIKQKSAKEFLSNFPRNRFLGSILMGVAMFWFWLLIVPLERSNPLGYLSMDLGEFDAAKKFLVVVVPVAAFLMIKEVTEFLAVRALGLLTLLVAAPMLYSCFQDFEPTGRVLLPLYAYVILTAGLFMIGMPYLLRDAIAIAIQNKKIWLGGAVAGLIYGVAVLVCSIIFWGGY